MKPEKIVNLVLPLTILSSLLLFGSSSQSESMLSPEVTTKLGKIIGAPMNVLGRNIIAYRGIPFAKPPVGPLRFMKPQPIEPWKGTLDATKFSANCPQLNLGNSSLGNISEDCLYINVWVPTSLYKKPVMLWIYGGSYLHGGADEYDGRALAAREDVVVVSFNYRLFIYGFLYLGQTDAPGNQGLWDQHMALVWVKNNIAEFGGDPQSITLFGQNAGSMSVGAHILSPHSRCMFHRAIMESDAPTVPNKFQEPNRNRMKIIEFCKYVGCCPSQLPTNAPVGTNVMQCLRNIPEADLTERVYMYCFTTPTGSVQDFYPVEGGEFFNGVSHCQNQPIDLLAGVVKNEGTLLVGYLAPPRNYTSLSGVSTQEAIQIWKDRKVLLTYKNETQIVNYYFNQPNSTPIENLASITGDLAVVCPVNYISQKISANMNNRVYMYFFDHRPSNAQYPPSMGVYEGSELPFVFAFPLFQPGYSQQDKEFSMKITKTWGGFAKYGIPRLPTFPITWPRYRATNQKALQLKPNDFRVVPAPRRDFCVLWKGYFNLPN